MRKLIVTVVGSLMIGVAVLAGSQSGGGSLTVDDILANVFKAKGGLDKWHAVETLKMSGRATAQGFEVPITIYSKRPNLTRQEIAVAPGQISINAFDGSTAWMVSPMSPTPVVLAGPQAEMTKQQADFDGSLVDYKAKGTAIDLVGTETIDGVKAYHLKVTRKNGLAEHDYIDASDRKSTRLNSSHRCISYA